MFKLYLYSFKTVLCVGFFVSMTLVFEGFSGSAMIMALKKPPRQRQVNDLVLLLK